MEQVIINEMEALGFSKKIGDIFLDWEKVKDELLEPDKKTGTGNGTIHVFLGKEGYSFFQNLYPDYFNHVNDTNETVPQAPKIKHFFSKANLISSIGHACNYYVQKKETEKLIDLVTKVATKLNETSDRFYTSESLFKWSTGSKELRPYFKQFDEGFQKTIRPLLLPNSAYKISLFQNENNECAAFWLIGFDGLTDFEVDSSTSYLRNGSDQCVCQAKKLTDFILQCIKYFESIDKLNAIVPYAAIVPVNNPIKVSKNGFFALTGMFLEADLDTIHKRNESHQRWFEDEISLGEKTVYLSTQWNASGGYQLTLRDFEKLIKICYGRCYCYKLGKNKDHQLWITSSEFTSSIEEITNVQQVKDEVSPVAPTYDKTYFDSQDYLYMSAIKTKPFLILGGFSGTGKSLLVKRLAFATCPCDGTLNLSETTPGNYLLVSVKPNWHDATDITGFRSSVNRNYYVTDFLRFLVKAKKYENQKVPFFVCLDEMNLAPVEEYFAEFLSVIESRKRTNDGRIVTDSIVSASVFNAKDYADDFNIFLSLGLTPIEEVKDITEFTARIKENGNESEYFEESWLVDELKQEGLTIPSNVIIVGTVNMDDTTNSFSRKVIDRAMTFETVIGEFGDSYFDDDVALNYVKNPFKGELFISDEVRATEMLDKERFSLEDEKKKEILDFINNINEDLEGSPFKISYRILNETILLYRSKIEIEKIIKEDGGFENGIKFNTDLNSIFDDILMQKILPRIEGDYDKCNKCLESLKTRAHSNGWSKSEEKIEFMIKRFGSDNSGFTSFWN